MECDEFIAGYSSYRDGFLDPGREERFRDHLEACSSCARYDRVVTRGTEVLRDLPRPEPSPDFLSRLRHRIYHVRDGIPLDGTRGGSAAAVAVAAVGLLAFAWLPFATQVPVEVELPAVAVEGPAASAEDVAAPEAGTAETMEMPRFFEPGLLVDGEGGDAAAGWYGAGLWPGSGYPASTGLGEPPGMSPFLVTTRTSTPSGR